MILNVKTKLISTLPGGCLACFLLFGTMVVYAQSEEQSGLESLRQELDVLSAELSTVLDEKSSLDEKEAYVTKVLALRERILAPECAVDKERQDGDWSGPEQHYTYAFYDHTSGEIVRVLISTGPSDGSMFVVALQSPKDKKFGPYTSMQEAEAKAEELCGGSPKEGTPVLKLIKITGPEGARSELEKYDFKENQSGYTVRQNARYSGEARSILSVAISYAPLEIIPGKPFYIEAEARQVSFVKRRSAEYCDRISNSSEKSETRWPHTNNYGSSGSFSPGIVIKAFLLEGWARAKTPVGCGDGRVKLKFKLVPVKQEYVESFKETRFTYAFEVESNGISVGGSNNLGDGKREREVFRITSDEQKGYELDIEIKPRGPTQLSPLTLRYKSVEGETVIASLPPFNFPPELTQPPGDDEGTDDTQIADEETDTTREPDEVEDEGGDPAAGPDESTEIDTVVVRDPVGPGSEEPVDPDALDPNKPDVAVRIRQWLSVAKPPASAVPGTNWRYDQFGRAIGGGGTTGIVVDSGPTVDYGTGATPEGKAWSQRKNLDSINNCTLEEFVVAKLQDKTIAHCIGRYTAMKNLKAMSPAEVSREIAKAKARYNLDFQKYAGSSARSKKQEGTVESQNPAADQHLKRGQTVTLYFYGPYSPPRIKVPELADKKYQEARKILKELGLVATAVIRKPAQSKKQGETVISQKPAFGEEATPGQKIVLFIYGKYREKTPEQKVASLNCSSYGKAEAYWNERELRAECKCQVGYSYISNKKTCAPTRETLVRNAECSYANSVARWDDQANEPRCYCKSGFVWNTGRTACVQSKETLVRNAECSYTNSVARWDDQANEPRCFCNSGFVWNAQQTACVPQHVVKSWSGTWKTNFQMMSLQQNGNQVTGHYGHDKGRIVGTISAGRLQGTWSEAPTYQPSNDAGDFEFILSKDGKSFSGRWRYGSVGNWGEWTGTRQ